MCRNIANRNWYNAHNFYGDLGDLDAATLEDVLAFHDTYYGPNNAALVVAGDFDPAQARAWIEKYFGPITSRALPPQPDISEPPQTEERRASKSRCARAATCARGCVPRAGALDAGVAGVRHHR